MILRAHANQSNYEGFDMDMRQKSLSLREQFEEEAKRLGGRMTANQHLFMQAARKLGREFEPAGVMAGSMENSELSCCSNNRPVADSPSGG